MSEYKDPIQIDADDPICSATALNGTVIGILFEKKGEEIQDAIDKRAGMIDTKVGEYKGIIKDTEEFLKKKEEEIKELDKIYTDRADLKKGELKPFQREIQSVQKKIEDVVFQFDKKTEEIVAGKAVGFVEGFEKHEKSFEEIDDLIEIEEAKASGKIVRTMGMRTNSGRLKSILGETGLQGSTGDAGIAGAAYTVTNNSGEMTLDSNYYSSPITKSEDKALAKLNTLKGLVREYIKKIQRIVGRIKELEEEKRRLILIRNNIRPDRDYKLDLNKLSAFGFESIEIK